ncbi:raptor N-terminal caspase like domain-containing protein [Hysterangium stoloniferum]|nr:raptor N-terminal caspase like domain-containing protein [Hysterangium stoloniferum]
MAVEDEEIWVGRQSTSYDSYQEEQADAQAAHSTGSVSSLPQLNSVMSFYLSKRHLTAGNPTPFPPSLPKLINWRYPPKIKMTNGMLLLCLNLDVDPPDVVKTQPCAVFECWVDPHSLPSNKAIEAIGTNLQHQFEALNPRMKYKPLLDPSVDDTRKFCINLRKLAQDERVLFSYNGHGVPRPTPSGELWVFNKTYSQYIPVSLWDLQQWLGSPCVYVWDTSSAGHLLSNYVRLAEQRDAELRAQNGGISPKGAVPFSDSLQLAACLADEQLPMCPDLPADLFTSCLTSPIETAIRWFLLKAANLPTGVTQDMVMQIPGDLKDRRTPLGELNWIFTAITDTIAWTTLPRETFKELFRRDLLVAALFRNFLLAERIMKNYHCTPHTHPPLPPTNTHPMWASWDLAVDACVAQLPRLLARDQAEPYEYIPSNFFSDSLTAFDVWLSRGGCALSSPTYDHKKPTVYPTNDPLAIPVSCDATYKHALVPRRPPDQLPIVLQVLLAQGHRLRALISFAQFCDLGPWAISVAMTIGIYPYMIKLLMAPPGDVRPVLIFIWARIIAVAPTVRNELLTNNGQRYFSQVLGAREEPTFVLIPNAAEHRAMCAFILTGMARGSLAGQTALAQDGVMEMCLARLADSSDYLLRTWVVLCIGQMWAQNDAIRDQAVVLDAQMTLINHLETEQAPDVRAALLYSLSTFLGASGTADFNVMNDLDDNINRNSRLARGGGGVGSLPSVSERGHYRLEAGLATTAMHSVQEDASPMVRKELVVLISTVVSVWKGHFVVCAWAYWEEERRVREKTTGVKESERSEVDDAIEAWRERVGHETDDEWMETCQQVLVGFFAIWVALLELAGDPYPEVAKRAQVVVDWVIGHLLDSPFAKLPGAGLTVPLSAAEPPRISQNGRRSRVASPQSLGSHPGHLRTPLMRGDLVNTAVLPDVPSLNRTSSFANALKSFGSYAFPPLEGFSRPASPAPSRPPSPPEDVGYEPVDVMEILIEADMERMRARKRKDPESDIVDVLPLKSTFFDWCNEYFTEPQMRQSESHEPGSVMYNMQLWRRSRNERILNETQAQAEIAPHCQWDRPVSTIHTSGVPQKIALHAFDTYIVSANDQDKISVWDWSQRKRLRSWSNGNSSTSNITALRFINDDTDGVVVVGSSDGIIRLWRHDDDEPVQLVSAFRAIPSLINVKRGPGLVFDWSQTAGAFTVGGDSKEIVVWDATSEGKVESLSTQSNSPLTTLTADFAITPIVVAGFADGVVKAFDRRIRDTDAVVRAYRVHSSWVVGARCQRYDEKALVTASMDGQVHLWDSRNASRSVANWHVNDRLASFDLHDQTSVFATTSSISQSNWRSHTTVIHSLPVAEPAVLSRVVHSTGLHHMPPIHAGQPTPHSSVVFHPNEMLYAVSTVDGTIRLLGCKLQERKEQAYAGILRPCEPPQPRASFDIMGSESF